MSKAVLALRWQFLSNISEEVFVWGLEQLPAADILQPKVCQIRWFTLLFRSLCSTWFSLDHSIDTEKFLT